MLTFASGYVIGFLSPIILIGLGVAYAVHREYRDYVKNVTD